eukprot:1181542-Amphidinium_carterae.1
MKPRTYEISDEVMERLLEAMEHTYPTASENLPVKVLPVEDLPVEDWNVELPKLQHGKSDRQRAIAALSYWKDPAEHAERLPALINTLMALETYTVEVDVALVTNAGLKEAQRH